MQNIGGDSPTNGAKNFIENSTPFIVSVTIEGVSEYLYHRWNNEAVKAKAESAKGSKTRTSDDLETYVYRDAEGFLCVPSEHLRMSLVYAAKYEKDPRSPRKSAMDLYKAGLIVLTKLASVGKKDWDFEDRRRVVIQRNAITRSRPALNIGWKCSFDIQVLLPEYISYHQLHKVLSNAGKLVGIGDFRPSYGRFNIVEYKII